jgi:hypothetical protein
VLINTYTPNFSPIVAFVSVRVYVSELPGWFTRKVSFGDMLSVKVEPIFGFTEADWLLELIVVGLLLLEQPAATNAVQKMMALKMEKKRRCAMSGIRKCY